MTDSKLQEQVKLWRSPGLGDIELMHANYLTQSFPRHTHEGFGVGVIERGALEFYYRGENVVASPGVINIVNPGEVHTGHAATDQGWTYRMFYFGANLLQDAASEISGKPTKIPFFQTGVIHDDYLAGIIHSLHMSLEEGSTSLLERQSRFLLMLVELIERHADDPPCPRTAGKEHDAVNRSKEFIEAHYNENLSIDTLAEIINLSPFHFIRTFCRQVGLPPHAYLIQTRVKRAKDLLRKGWKIVDVAYETGFSDQSHLSNRFKRIMGFTPGQYSNFVQDARGCDG
jgi:AraC-like DNA-binding protein